MKKQRQSQPGFPFPMQDLQEVHHLLRQVQQTFRHPLWPDASRQPPVVEFFPVEIWESPDRIFVNLRIPGLRHEREVKVLFHDEKTLSLQARLPRIRPSKECKLIRTEFSHGRFERKISLPVPVSKASYSTRYQNGIFWLILQKLTHVGRMDAGSLDEEDFSEFFIDDWED